MALHDPLQDKEWQQTKKHSFHGIPLHLPQSPARLCLHAAHSRNCEFDNGNHNNHVNTSNNENNSEDAETWPELTLLRMQGVGERIAARDVPKIAILNGNHDRETSASLVHEGPMNAADIVLALQHSLNRRHTDTELNWSEDAFVTALLVPGDGEIHVDKAKLRSLGVRYTSTL